MRVLVTGGTGFLGSHLCARLVGEGYEVTVLRRPTSDLGGLSRLGVRSAIGDVTDADSVNRAVDGQRFVIHAAALVGAASAAVHTAVNETGTCHVAAACRRLGVERLVHVSSVAAVGIPDDRRQPADEGFMFNLEGSPLGYHLSKRRAEQAVSRAAAEGLDAVIVNPSAIKGPHGQYFRGDEIPNAVRRRTVVPCFSGGTNVVHVDDVVDGVLGALRRGRTGERYILGGENLTWRQLARVAADLIGVRRMFVTVPAMMTGAAALSGRTMERLTGHRPRVTDDVHFCASRFLFYDSRKAMTELDFRPRPYAQIVREYLDGEWSRGPRQNPVSDGDDAGRRAQERWHPEASSAIANPVAHLSTGKWS
ncbi:MAG TPA: NAD-dependent epimerase/dehydratase family protein [Stellaceae bacterium]|nr:NAD-dependent epimerase/dehydratase family protein [Stellaceae bacterium]